MKTVFWLFLSVFLTVSFAFDGTEIDGLQTTIAALVVVGTAIVLAVNVFTIGSRVFQNVVGAAGSDDGSSGYSQGDQAAFAAYDAEQSRSVEDLYASDFAAEELADAQPYDPVTEYDTLPEHAQEALDNAYHGDMLNGDDRSWEDWLQDELPPSEADAMRNRSPGDYQNTYDDFPPEPEEDMPW